MSIFKTSDCSCGPWLSILPPPPCRVHQPQAWLIDQSLQPYVTTTTTTTFIPADVSPVKHPPRKSRKHG